MEMSKVAIVPFRKGCHLCICSWRYGKCEKICEEIYKTLGCNDVWMGEFIRFEDTNQSMKCLLVKEVISFHFKLNDIYTGTGVNIAEEKMFILHHIIIQEDFSP